MGVSTICPGCGQRVQAPQGYTRRKMQCSACGVMCELPEPGEERAPANPAKSRPASAPRAAVDQPPARSTRKMIEDGPEEAAVHVCRVCGEKVRIATGADSKLAHCSVCGTPITILPADTSKRSGKRRPKRTATPPLIPPALRPKPADPLEAEERYDIRDKTKSCPNCDGFCRMMPCSVPDVVTTCKRASCHRREPSRNWNDAGSPVCRIAAG